MLLRLTSFARPGLTEKQLKESLIRCKACRLFMGRDVFDGHECRERIEFTGTVDIDLTLEDSDDE